MKVVDLKELSLSITTLRTLLYAELQNNFRVSDGYLFIAETYVEHPTHGNSIIVEYTGDNKLYRVPYNEVENDVVLGKTNEWVEVVKEYKEVTTTQTDETQADVEEVASITIAENEVNQPLILNMRLIKEGFGNKRNNHYYSKRLLQSSSDMFKGVKMYVTEHRANEVNVRNEVAQVIEAKYDEEAGGIVARVGVFDENFATNVRNRQSLGILDGLACSIRAIGNTYSKEYVKDGRTGRMVKEFTKVLSVDFVTAAGAGGKAISIES